MVRSPIQLKKQKTDRAVQLGVGWDRGMEGWIKFVKRGVGNIGFSFIK